MDVASGGELFAALRAGFPPERIYLHGNNKDAREIGEALDAGVGTIVIDNLHEIDLLQREASARGLRQRVLVRVTPGVKPSTHSYIATGQLDSKFGLSIEGGAAAAGVEAVRGAPALDLVGLHCHVGSQLFDLSVYPAAAAIVAGFAAACGGEDLGIVNMGGGLGIAYTRDDRPAAVEDYAEAVVDAVHQEWARAGLARPRVLVEPGRSIVGRAGVTLYRVGGVKEIPGVRTYASVDGGMSDLLRPDALRRGLRAPARQPGRRRAHRHAAPGGQALRERRRAGGRGVTAAGRPPATWCACRRRAPTVCRWPPTTTGSPGPRCVFVDGGRARLVTRRETLRRPRGAGRVTGSRAPVRIGLLGCGTVGQAVVRTLLEGGATIERASGHRLEVGPILVRDPRKPRPGVDPELITTDPARVLEDPSVSIVVEVMGGLDPALGYLRAALAARPVGGDGQQAAALAPRAGAAPGGRRRPAPSCASRPRPAPPSRSSRCCASRCSPPRSRRSPASSTAPRTSSSPRWRGAGCPTATRWRGPRSWATRRPTPPRTWTAPTPPPRWRSSPRSPSTCG